MNVAQADAVLQFSICRYVPDIARDEAVNIGVLLWEPSENRFLGWRFLPAFSRVQRLHPDADLGTLKALRDHIETEVARYNDDARALVTLLQEFSNTVQFTHPKAVSTTDSIAELNRLYQTYVEDPYDQMEEPRSGFVVERRHPRYHYNVRARLVSVAGGDELRGTTENVSLGGIFIRSRAILARLELVRLALYPSNRPPIDVEAIVRHASVGAGMGLEFSRRERALEKVVAPLARSPR